MRRRGFTLIEVLISISLLGLLSTGMLLAIRIALNSQQKASAKLMDNRRVVGSQRALEEELNSFMPEVATLDNGQKVPFFDGEPQSMRFGLPADDGQFQRLETALIKTGSNCRSCHPGLH